MDGMGAPGVWIVTGWDKEEVWFTVGEEAGVDPGTFGSWMKGEVIEGKVGEESDSGGSSLQIEGEPRAWEGLGFIQ